MDMRFLSRFCIFLLKIVFKICHFYYDLHRLFPYATVAAAIAPDLQVINRENVLNLPHNFWVFQTMLAIYYHEIQTFEM